MGERAQPSTFAEKDLNYYLRMIRADFAEQEEIQPAKLRGPFAQKNIVILLTSPSIGESKGELGQKLLVLFLQSLINNQTKPKAVILMNKAVHLAVEPEAAVSKLIVLEEQGTKVMACISSTDEFGLTDKLKIGFVASMDEICEQLLSAWKVISF